MICHLSDNNPLKIQARHIFANDTESKSKSWFLLISELCDLYNLPSCSYLLNIPLNKDKFKNLVKLKILDYWQALLRKEANNLKSLLYFKPEFYSLKFPCKSFSAANVNRYEIQKLNIQQKMLSGRYRTSMLKRFWTKNKMGTCELDPECSQTCETISHILICCPALSQKRQSLFQDWITRTDGVINCILSGVLNRTQEQKTQFILDPLTDPVVIRFTQEYGEYITQKMCCFTRTFCHSIHKERMKILNKNQFSTSS